jgi:hypothetical protein
MNIEKIEKAYNDLVNSEVVAGIGKICPATNGESLHKKQEEAMLNNHLEWSQSRGFLGP